MNPIVILHGWSDTSKSFAPLARFLKGQGYSVVDLWLGDYISLDDDVGVEDVAKRMHAVLAEKETAGELARPFDMIVHSTGGLVARQWLLDYHAGDPASCPVQHLIMLAPANFGSHLAHKGQSLLGRVVKGWNNWFHTGKRMLDQLEMGSPYLWRLAEGDLLASPGQAVGKPLYGPGGILVFVIVGSHPYAKGLRQIVNERGGGDGTVRVAASSLDCCGATIDFTTGDEQPVLERWGRRSSSAIPLVVLPDRTHGSVTDPEDNDIHANLVYYEGLGSLILQALACDSVQGYAAIATAWDEISEKTARLASDPSLLAQVFPGSPGADPDFFHQYFQVLVHVVDDHGADVDDYFLEFTGPDDDPRNDAMVYFQREVLEKVHVCGANPAYRCLFVDRTDLMENFYAKIGGKAAKQLNMSLSATPLGANVGYFASLRRGAKGSLPIHYEKESQRAEGLLKRNATHLVKIVIPRTPGEKVFSMKKF